MTVLLTGDAKLGGATVELDIDLRKTYLHTNNDPLALNADALVLANYGIGAGDVLVFDPSIHSGTFFPDFAAVFSTSATLTASSNLNRVTGAVTAINALTGAAFDPVLTPKTMIGSQTTNIIKDFLMPSEEHSPDADVMSAFAVVPTSASHLFLSAIDNFFGDNTGTFHLEIDRPLAIGISGTGTGSIIGAQHFADRVVLLGLAPNADGTLTVGAGGSLQVGGSVDSQGDLQSCALVAGLKGTGALNIVDGGVVTLGSSEADASNFDAGEGSIFAGFDVGSEGTISVSGVGSHLNVKGFDGIIGLGLNGGTADLKVTSGGTIAAQALLLGFQFLSGTTPGASGTATINGRGSKVTLSFDDVPLTGETDQTAGYAMIGGSGGGTGALTVSGAGKLEIRNSHNENGTGMTLGEEYGTVGEATVTGAGTRLDILLNAPAQGGEGAELLVGNRGEGHLVVDRKAQVLIKGHDAALIVSLGDGIFAPETNPPVDQLELSTARIASGADVFVTANNSNGTGENFFGAQVVIGDRYNADGELIVEGVGSRLNISGNMLGTSFNESARLTVGGEGRGALIVRNGADVLINGTNDGRAVFQVGAGRSMDFVGPPIIPGPSGDRHPVSTGVATITGDGTTLTLTSNNSNASRGNVIYVGREAGATGTLIVSDGAQLLNSVGSTNSVTAVGADPSLSNLDAGETNGTVIVDGNGNTNTLFDAGHLMLVGQRWSGLGANWQTDAFGGMGGEGHVVVLDGATLRANTIVFGDQSSLRGNAFIDGDVRFSAFQSSPTTGFVNAGTETDGTSGVLTISGDFILESFGARSLIFDINGTGAGTGHDQIDVGGTFSFQGLSDIRVNINTALTAGDSFVLIDAGQLDYSFISMFELDGVFNGLSANQAYLIGVSPTQVLFEALNSNGVGPAVVDFGQASTNGATALLQMQGLVSQGSGGRFEDVVFRSATGLAGTAAADNFTSQSDVFTTLLGRGGNDTLFAGSSSGGALLDGGTGADTLTGGSGVDTLIGGSGNDTMHGRWNENTYNGGTGDDTMQGYSERDVFVYDSLDFDNDRILEFQNNVDKIDLAVVGLTYSDFTVTSAGGDTILTLTDDPSNTITLVGFSVNLLNAADFI